MKMNPKIMKNFEKIRELELRAWHVAIFKSLKIDLISVRVKLKLLIA